MAISETISRQEQARIEKEIDQLRTINIDYTKWASFYNSQRKNPPTTMKADTIRTLNAEIVALRAALEDLEGRGIVGVEVSVACVEKNMVISETFCRQEQARIEEEIGQLHTINSDHTKWMNSYDSQRNNSPTTIRADTFKTLNTEIIALRAVLKQLERKGITGVEASATSMEKNMVISETFCRQEQTRIEREIDQLRTINSDYAKWASFYNSQRNSSPTTVKADTFGALNTEIIALRAALKDLEGKGIIGVEASVTCIEKNMVISEAFCRQEQARNEKEIGQLHAF